MKRCILYCFLFLNFSLSYADNVVNLSLEQCENSALKNSPSLKIHEYQSEAALQNLKTQNEALYPSLNLDASASYNAVIPSLTFMGEKINLIDNWSYSIGPTLKYILFDGGVQKGNYKSFQNLYESKKQDLEWEKKNVTVSVRLQYFQVQSALEKIYILGECLKLAKSQYQDILINYNSGANSKIDLLMADKQVLTATSQIETARANLSNSLRVLFELTMDNFGIDPSYPCDYRLTDKEYINNASCILKTDDVDTAINKFSVFENYEFDDLNANLLSLDKIEQYYKNVAESYKSQKYPLLIVEGGIYYQYPNGPIKEQILQKTACAVLSMPVFESGSKKAAPKANELNVSATQEQKTALKSALKKDFYNAKDKLFIIKTQSDINSSILKNSRKIANLTYSSYKFGR